MTKEAPEIIDCVWYCEKDLGGEDIEKWPQEFKDRLRRYLERAESFFKAKYKVHAIKYSQTDKMGFPPYLTHIEARKC